MNLDLERLVFRRQFLIGPQSFTPNSYWNVRPLLNGLILSHHCDLPVDIHEHGGKLIGILGRAYDASEPSKTQAQMAEELLVHSDSVHQVIRKTWPWAGRWVVLFQVSSASYIFSDPAGLRQIFYSFHQNGPWVGSQPEIIKQMCPLRYCSDSDFVAFITHPQFAQSECSWVGDHTLYDDCYHLLPNHYLDLVKKRAIRFFPDDQLESQELPKVVAKASEIFRGIYRAVVHREGCVLQALTAGWDSRVLLAASKEVSNHVEYFIDRHGVLQENHPDVKIPLYLADRLGLRFHVRDTRDILPGWFTGILVQNVSGARIIPKTRIIFGHFLRDENRINLNGNTAEIARNAYDEYGLIPENRQLTVDELVNLFAYTGYSGIDYVRNQLQLWKQELDERSLDTARLLDFMYWEQRMGNWGAFFPAEQDIAIDEIAPFNCRSLLETLIAAPRELRTRPKWTLFRELIREMWPDALNVPIYGTSVKSFHQMLKDALRSSLPPWVIRGLKRLQRC